MSFLIGLDFGTDSVRAVVVGTDDGREVATKVAYYPRWSQGRYCVPGENQFRQHPLDYLEAMEEAVTGALAESDEDLHDEIVGIGVDTTGSTPAPVDETGTPLALKEEFRDNPNAMFILWKDHTAVEETEEINRLSKTWSGPDFTKYEGGVYSSEWFWSKIIHTVRRDEDVRKAAYSWVEHCDWIPAVLTGNTDPETMKRSRCAAGHKAMWHPEWGGLPDEEFLVALEPRLKGLRDRLYRETHTADEKAGELTGEWAERLGLPAGISVAVGAFDAHMGAVGSQIGEQTLVKIMGTSTCDVMVADRDQLGGRVIEGICGQVDGSVIPGLIGLEAGQSAFGDVYAFWEEILAWPLEEVLPLVDDDLSPETIEAAREKILVRLTEEARRLEIDETGLVALDWLNGRRTPYADQTLKGAILGLNLGTTAPKIFRSLVEATAFGSKVIVDHFVDGGVPIEEIIGIGGIPHKNDFVMQVTADVLNRPIKVARSEQTCALGAAMFAAVAAGAYERVEAARDQMGSGFQRTYHPDPGRAERYQSLYDRYLAVADVLEPHLREL